MEGSNQRRSGRSRRSLKRMNREENFTENRSFEGNKSESYSNNNHNSDETPSIPHKRKARSTTTREDKNLSKNKKKPRNKEIDPADLFLEFSDDDKMNSTLLNEEVGKDSKKVVKISELPTCASLSDGENLTTIKESGNKTFKAFKKTLRQVLRDFTPFIRIESNQLKNYIPKIVRKFIKEYYRLKIQNQNDEYEGLKKVFDSLEEKVKIDITVPKSLRNDESLMAYAPDEKTEYKTPNDRYIQYLLKNVAIFKLFSSYLEDRFKVIPGIIEEKSQQPKKVNGIVLLNAEENAILNSLCNLYFFRCCGGTIVSNAYKGEHNSACLDLWKRFKKSNIEFFTQTTCANN